MGILSNAIKKTEENQSTYKVEAIKIERHSGDSHSGEPDSHDGPGSKEEVEGTGVVERSILEDEAAEVSVSSNNVVSLFFLSKLVSNIGRFRFSGLADQRGGDQGSVHGREERGTEDTGNTGHVEGVHKDVVLSLEHQHIVEGSRDAQRHTIRERSLPNGVVEEDSSGSSNRGRESSEDPGAHAKAVRKLPLTAHVGSNSNQKVEDGQLVLSSIVQPLIHGGSLPDRVQVHSNSIGGWDHGSTDDVVSVQEGSSNRLTDSINVD